MALNGSTSVAVTSHDTLKFSWTATQSVSANTSTISWSLQLITDGYGRIDSTRGKSYTIIVNGTTYSGTNYIGIANNATKTLVSGSTTVAHNADGSKTFTYSFNQQFDITFSGKRIGYISGSGSGALNVIPRGAIIVSAPNFTDEDNPTITYSNPAGSAVTSLSACISLTGSKDDIPYRAVSVSGTSYTFTLTDAERATLRNATTTSKTRTVYFYLKTVVSGSTLASKVAKTLTITNCTPTFTFEVVDTDAKAISLTGDNSKLIKYVSDAAYTLNTSAKKGATISGWTISTGGNTKTSSTGTFTDVESGSFVVSVIDTRGYTNSKTITKTFIEYVKPTCSLKVSTPTGEGNATLTLTGNCFNGSFGAVTNGVSVSYRYKKYGATSFSDWVTVTSTKNGSAYAATASVTGLDYKSAYVFQGRITDSLNAIVTPQITVKSTPVFDWGASDFKFNVPVSIDGDVSSNKATLQTVAANTATLQSLTADSAELISTTITDALYDKYGQLMTNGMTVYTSSGINPDTTLDHLILTSINTPTSAFMYIKTEFYAGKTTSSNRMQIAFPYNKKRGVFYRYYYNGAWTEWISMTNHILPGDTFEITSYHDFYGRISGSSTAVRASIYIGRPILATGVSVSGNVTLRGVKGYIGDATYENGISTSTSGYTWACSIMDAQSGIVQVSIQSSATLSNATNNTPITLSGAASKSLTLTFK